MIAGQVGYRDREVSCDVDLPDALSLVGSVHGPDHATGTAVTTGESSATSVRGAAGCTRDSGVSATCAAGSTTRSCWQVTADHPVSASTRSRRSRCTISSRARRCCPSAPPAATWAAGSVRTGTSQSPGRSTPCPRRPPRRLSPRPPSGLGCRSVAFTYNDPVIFMEYAIDVADACRERGIAAVAVSAGYQNPGPREEFYRHMDAANIDLKGFSDDFYKKITFSERSAVLETLEYLASTSVWFEVTTLLIPGHNDGDAELGGRVRLARAAARARMFRCISGLSP